MRVNNNTNRRGNEMKWTGKNILTAGLIFCATVVMVSMVLPPSEALATDPGVSWLDTIRGIVSTNTGVSSTEFEYLDGVSSSIQTQLNARQAIVSAVSTTELSYVDGVTSSIQDQIDAKDGPSAYTCNGGFLVGTGTGTNQEEFLESGTCTNAEAVTYAVVLTSITGVQLTYAESPGNSTSVNVSLYPSSVCTTGFTCNGVAAKEVYYTVHGVK